MRINVRRSSTVSLDCGREHPGRPRRMGVDARALHGGRGPRPRAPHLRRARAVAPAPQGVRAPRHARRRRRAPHERPRRDLGLRRVVRHHPRRRSAGARVWPNAALTPPTGASRRSCSPPRAGPSASGRSSCCREPPSAFASLSATEQRQLRDLLAEAHRRRPRARPQARVASLRDWRRPADCRALTPVRRTGASCAPRG